MKFNLKDEMTNLAASMDDAIIFVSTQAMGTHMTKKFIDKKIDKIEAKCNPPKKGLFSFMKKHKVK